MMTRCILWLLLLATALAQPPSHIEGNVPDANHFEAYLRRDLEAYFGGRPVTFEYLRRGPTQSGVAFPKYYFWVGVRDLKSKQLWQEGAVRVAAVARTHFEVTTFMSLKDLKLAPEQAAEVFPKPVAEEILRRLRK